VNGGVIGRKQKGTKTIDISRRSLNPPQNDAIETTFKKLIESDTLKDDHVRAVFTIHF
jgi:hypothetical protein